MANMVKGRADYLALGDYNTVCYECGRKRKASTLKRHWQGYYVCPEHWEVRHPQDFVRGVQDIVTPPWSQPMPADQFIATVYYDALMESVSSGTSYLVTGAPIEVSLTENLYVSDTGVGGHFLTETGATLVQENGEGLSQDLPLGVVAVMNTALTVDVSSAATVATGTTFTSTVVESVAVTDTLSVVWTATVALTEAVTVGELVYPGSYIVETVATGDSLTVGLVMAAAFTEGIGLGEGVTTQIPFFVSLTEGVTVDATPVPANTMGVSYTEAVTATDGLSAPLAYTATVTEGVTVTDAVLVSASTFGVTLTEGLSVGDLVADGGTHVTYDSLSEGVTVGTGFTAPVIFRPALTEPVATGDGLTVSMLAGVSLTEPVTTGSGLTSTTAYTVTLTEAVTVGETISAPSGAPLNAAAINVKTVN